MTLQIRKDFDVSKLPFIAALLLILSSCSYKTLDTTSLSIGFSEHKNSFQTVAQEIIKYPSISAIYLYEGKEPSIHIARSAKRGSFDFKFHNKPIDARSLVAALEQIGVDWLRVSYKRVDDSNNFTPKALYLVTERNAELPPILLQPYRVVEIGQVYLFDSPDPNTLRTKLETCDERFLKTSGALEVYQPLEESGWYVYCIMYEPDLYDEYDSNPFD